MKRIVLAAVLTVALVASSANAASSVARTAGAKARAAATRTEATPYSYTGSIIESDPVRVSYDTLARKNYGWKAATAYCYIKNVAGQHIAGFKVRYHWSWWINPIGTDTIKNWWRESSYPTDLKYGWAYIGAYEAGGSGGPGQTWAEHKLVGQFKQDVFHISVLVTEDTYMWPDGGGVTYCSHT